MIMYRSPEHDVPMAHLGGNVWHRIPTREPQRDEPADWEFAVASQSRCGLRTFGMRHWHFMPPLPQPQMQCSECKTHAEINGE
jgi:hypothetical protein